MKKILPILLLAIFTFSCEEISLKKIKKSFHETINSFTQKEEDNDDVIASEEFAQGSEDVPLLIGMEKISEETLGFDSSSGSIVSSSYLSTIQEKNVREYYLKTLPTMGWKIVKNLKEKIVLVRDKENLEIEFAKENDKDVVRFFISSAL